MQKIMFNDKYGLTEAVLEGRKTQTRRLAIRCKEDIQVMDGLNLSPEDNAVRQYVIEKYSRYKIGEILAVAQNYETVNDEYIDKVFRCHGKTGRDILDNGMEACKTCENPGYCLDKYASVCASPGWQNKMFVKADLMLHQIRITDIRLERLQDISNADCFAEGVTKWTDEKEYNSSESVRKSIDEMEAAGYETFAIPGCWGCYTSPKEAYAALIDKVSGKGTWDKNPWVFVYDFEFVK